jgi:hypothetical protein
MPARRNQGQSSGKAIRMRIKETHAETEQISGPTDGA